MAATRSIDDIKAKVHSYATIDLVRALSGKDQPGQVPVAGELKDVLFAELATRDNIVPTLARVFGATFLIQSETPESVFYPLTRDENIEGVLKYILKPKAPIIQETLKKDDGEDFTVVRPDYDLLADHLALAKSVVRFRPDHNAFVAKHIMYNLRRIRVEKRNPFMGTINSDPFLSPAINGGAIEFEKHPRGVAVAATQRLAEIETAQAILTSYGEIPQLCISHELGKNYLRYVNAASNLMNLLRLQPTPAFSYIVTNIRQITEPGPASVLDVGAISPTTRLKELRNAGDRLTRSDERDANFERTCKMYPNKVAAMLKLLPHMLKAEGRELGHWDKVYIRSSLNNAVLAMKQTPDNPAFDRLAGIVNTYPEDIQETLASAIGKASLPMRRMTKLLNKLVTPTL